MNARTCSNAIRACSKLDATITVSPRGTTSGPSNVAAEIPAVNEVLPFALATDSAAVVTSVRNAPRMKRPSHGNTRNGSPASRP